MKKENINNSQNNFDAFIEEFTELDLKEKQKIVIDEFKEMLAVISKLCEDYKINYEILLNRELTDVTQTNYTEDDFVEATYVYIQSLKELLASYINENIKNDYE